MKKIFNIFCFMAIIPAWANEPAEPQKAQAKNLVIIVMNGVRYEDAYGEKHHLYIDNIWNKLRPQGTICTKFENREQTLPIPAQMSMLTGVWHVFKDPLSENIRPACPTLFEYWNKARTDTVNACYFASNKAKFKILTASANAEFGDKLAPVYISSPDTCENENGIYEKALPYIMEKHPPFVYISLGSAGGGGTRESLDEANCELKGKKDACGAGALLNAYYESIILMDAIVYDLWDRIQKVDAYKNNTLLLVLSAHGRHAEDFHSYGDKCKGCTQLFLLAVGPGIKKNFESTKGRKLIDVCKTVGAYFNIPTQFAKGDVMKEIFE